MKVIKKGFAFEYKTKNYKYVKILVHHYPLESRFITIAGHYSKTILEYQYNFL